MPGPRPLYIAPPLRSASLSSGGLCLSLICLLLCRIAHLGLLLHIGALLRLQCRDAVLCDLRPLRKRYQIL
jgi:hypothetical protein